MKISTLHLIKDFLKLSFLATCFFLFNSCADSDVAIKLANSFDAPLQNQNLNGNQDQIADRKLLIEKTLKETKTSKKSISLSQDTKSSSSKDYISVANPVKLKKPIKPTNRNKEFSPQPYRIIIRLSGANPSAPAESVTRALRDAGVVFEVEKIELFESKPPSKRKIIEVN